MSETTPETTHFGLTRVGQGETYSKNGYAFSDLDRVDLDNILYAAVTHTHDGSGRLGDPATVPGLAGLATGGTLPAGTTFYYRTSFVDKYGLETASSDESSVVTADPLPAPTPPSAIVETTGGTVSTGTWTYMVTYTTASGGETTPSGINNVQVPTGSTNRVRLTFPALPTGASGWTVYRSRPGQQQFYYLDTSTSPVYYDTGGPEDQTITAPTINTTNSTNSIVVTIPGGSIPVGCQGWKIYRALDSGGYDGNSLVHFVVEGSTDTSTDIITTWTDTGDALLPGFPRETSATIPGGAVVSLAQLAGQFPLASTPRGSRLLTGFAPGLIADNQVVTRTSSPLDVQPLRITAQFGQPLTDGGTTITFRVLDGAATPNYVDLVCPTAPATPVGPTGYYEVDFPLYLAQVFEAETGTRSNTSAVPIVTDVAASNGQAVALDAQNEMVSLDLDVLQPGTYQIFATVRVSAYASATNDLIVQAVRTDTNAVLASTTFSLGTGAYPQTANYQELTGPSFTAPGDVGVALQVLKATTSAQSYYVDVARYAATVPTLAAGPLTVQALVAGSNTTARDANVVLWF